MSIVQTIASSHLQARKDKSPNATFIGTLLAEIKRVGFDDGKRDTTDKEAIQVIQKFIKNAQQNIAIIGDGDISALENELDILREFLPKQVEVDVLASIAKEHKDNGKSLGDYIKHIKATFEPGTFEPAGLKNLFESV